MSRLDSLVFLWRRRAFIEEAVKPLIFDRPKQVLMSLCVAGVALHDILTTFVCMWTSVESRFWDRRNTLARFS